MKEYAVQKQLIPADTNAGDPNWAKRQIWVYKLNGEDTLDEYESLRSVVGLDTYKTFVSSSSLLLCSHRKA